MHTSWQDFLCHEWAFSVMRALNVSWMSLRSTPEQTRIGHIFVPSHLDTFFAHSKFWLPAWTFELKTAYDTTTVTSIVFVEIRATKPLLLYRARSLVELMTKSQLLFMFSLRCLGQHNHYFYTVPPHEGQTRGRSSSLSVKSDSVFFNAFCWWQLSGREGDVRIYYHCLWFHFAQAGLWEMSIIMRFELWA